MRIEDYRVAPPRLRRGEKCRCDVMMDADLYNKAKKMAADNGMTLPQLIRDLLSKAAYDAELTGL